MNRREKKRLLCTPRWARLRAATLNGAGWRCSRRDACPGPGFPLEVHHIKPTSQGGDFWDPANLEVICKTCHINHHRGPVDPNILEWDREMRREKYATPTDRSTLRPRPLPA